MLMMTFINRMFNFQVVSLEIQEREQMQKTGENQELFPLFSIQADYKKLKNKKEFQEKSIRKLYKYFDICLHQSKLEIVFYNWYDLKIQDNRLNVQKFKKNLLMNLVKIETRTLIKFTVKLV